MTDLDFSNQRFLVMLGQFHAYGCLLQRKVVLDDNSLLAHDDRLPMLDDR